MEERVQNEIVLAAKAEAFETAERRDQSRMLIRQRELWLALSEKVALRDGVLRRLRRNNILVVQIELLR